MAALLAATALTLTACSGDDDMQAKPETDVNAVVQQHADAVAVIAGQALQNPSLTPHGCTGPNGQISDTIYTVQGVYNLPAPTGEKHLDVIARIRADWKTKGYTITDDRTVAADRGVAAAKTPDGYKLDVETATPDGFAVFVDSPCYERP
ncbi:hypothetical protein ADL15_21905 [Actinoplanes awajinensis subsp. mycoplanecinus]|uniref:Uncharacterized protein n=2 Tax=Actinoplanes awajinensis TaxID=135946 RepID=A0A124GA92_9ACTN|nr:hypothetical protein ADL15_21905 [Actinoplanes awajinensis subsp. mycoplanecinus]